MKLCERIQLPKRKTEVICMQGVFHGKIHGAHSLTTAAYFQRVCLLGVPKENVIYVPYGNIAAVKAAIEAESTGNGTNGIIAAFVEPIRGTACEVAPTGFLTELARQIGRASCRERVCQYV